MLSLKLKHKPAHIYSSWGKDKQVGIHNAYYLVEQLEKIGATFRTYYQMSEGHVPRPFALKDTLLAIKQWMDDVEQNKLKTNMIDKML